MNSCISQTKIMLVSNCDGLANIACHRLFNSGSIDVVSVVSVKIDSRKKMKILEAAVRSGSLWYASYMQVEAFLSTVYAKIKLKKFSIKRAAKTKSIPVNTVSVLDYESLAKLVDRSGPDIIISVRPGLIFKTSITEYFPKIFNLHCSLLPAYAGIGGVIQALSNDEKILGISVHKIEDEKIDSGAVVAQSVIFSSPQKSVLWHTIALYERAADTLLKYCEKNEGVPNQHPPPSYNSWPGLDVYRRLRATGRGMIFPL